MKKLLFLLALLSIFNQAHAAIYMSQDLLMSSLKLSQEQWTSKCAIERLKIYSSIYGCSDPKKCPSLVHTLKYYCWQQYNTARQNAYFRK